MRTAFVFKWTLWVRLTFQIAMPIKTDGNELPRKECIDLFACAITSCIKYMFFFWSFLLTCSTVVLFETVPAGDRHICPGVRVCGAAAALVHLRSVCSVEAASALHLSRAPNLLFHQWSNVPAVQEVELLNLSSPYRLMSSYMSRLVWEHLILREQNLFQW